MPFIDSNHRHLENKLRFQNRVVEICSQANLANWCSATSEVRHALRHHLRTKNRYAGIRAQIATTEITQLTPLFDNYSWFCDPGWDIESKGYKIQSAGALSCSFLQRTGQFVNVQTIGNIPKLKKIVNVARSFKRYFDEHPNAPAFDFVTQNLSQDDTWAVHDQLLAGGYKADLTALHFMMDAGFQVIKPDLVISRLFLHWGWLHQAISSIPADLKREDLEGKGKYASRFLYTKPIIYKPIINLAQDIVQGINENERVADIGWATTNPIREFDIFVVKAGQLPEKEFGIERRLYP